VKEFGFRLHDLRCLPMVSLAVRLAIDKEKLGGDSAPFDQMVQIWVRLRCMVR
jgi:hypothetical protein